MYPALTVLQALDASIDLTSAQLSVLWVGGIGGMEVDLVKRKDVPFDAIPAAGVHGVGLRSLPGNLMQLSRGYGASRNILHSFRPDVMFFTGGYVGVPMALAGQTLLGKKPPTVLYVPDIEPGLALKTLARFADRIAVTTDDSVRYYPHKERVSVTGYPVRPELIDWTREQAIQIFNLAPDLPVLLVLGGSTGAQSINRGLVNVLPKLLNKMQIIHISGQRNWNEIQAVSQGLSPDLALRYHARPYLHEEIGAAFRVADLVLSRAGASVLGEYPLFGLPAVLVPYPYAWRYQHVNAEYLARRGAALILADADLSLKLLDTIQGLILDAEKLDQMRKAMRVLARPEAARRIADLIDKQELTDRSTI